MRIKIISKYCKTLGFLEGKTYEARSAHSAEPVDFYEVINEQYDTIEIPAAWCIITQPQQNRSIKNTE